MISLARTRIHPTHARSRATSAARPQNIFPHGCVDSTNEPGRGHGQHAAPAPRERHVRARAVAPTRPSTRTNSPSCTNEPAMPMKRAGRATKGTRRHHPQAPKIHERIHSRGGDADLRPRPRAPGRRRLDPGGGVDQAQPRPRHRADRLRPPRRPGAQPEREVRAGLLPPGIATHAALLAHCAALAQPEHLHRPVAAAQPPRASNRPCPAENTPTDQNRIAALALLLSDPGVDASTQLADPRSPIWSTCAAARPCALRYHPILSCSDGVRAFTAAPADYRCRSRHRSDWLNHGTHGLFDCCRIK
jgi:hypothetical protein